MWIINSISARIRALSAMLLGSLLIALVVTACSGQIASRTASMPSRPTDIPPTPPTDVAPTRQPDSPLTQQPEVTIRAHRSAATEGDILEFAVIALPAPATDLQVSVALTENASVLEQSPPSTVTIVAGATETVLTARTIDDNQVEPVSSVTATVSAGTGYSIGVPGSESVTVSDNDSDGRGVTPLQSIDAEQFCNRTPVMQIAILDAVEGATATCLAADRAAVPAIEARYETNITVGQFAAIKSLDLSPTPGRPISFIVREFKPADFDGLTGLRTMILTMAIQGREGLAQMGVPLSVLGMIEVLHLNDIDLARFDSVHFFLGLSNLRDLSVRYNNMMYELPGNTNRPELVPIGTIDPEIWIPLPNLRRLRIGANRILTLPPGFFRHLARLEVLDMYDMWYEYHPYGFGTQALPAGIFEGLTNLRELDLGHNAIGAAAVDDGLFDGLTSLQRLDLRKNPLLEVLPRSVLNLPAGVAILVDPGVTWPMPSRPWRPTTAP